MEDKEVMPLIDRMDYLVNRVSADFHRYLFGKVKCRRETFFLNQLRSAGHDVVYPPKGDFLVDGRWLFDVGGKGKGFGQVKDIPDSFVVNDDVEIGIDNKIPLWLFGFLY